MIGLIAVFLTGWATASADPDAFGFSGVEFHKLDWDTHNLRIADINGDGRNDVVVANNAKARIECLIQRVNPTEPPPPEMTEPNEIPNDPRFESRPFLAEKKIFSLELGDLNGDGRNDMAYYGDPRELVVVYQGEDGQWGMQRTFDIADGATKPAGLAIGDVNGDGRNDLVLLATDGVYFIRQVSPARAGQASRLDAPVKEWGLPQGAIALFLRDFNGDGREDLLYVCTSEEAPLCFRFQEESGDLGPEIRCKAAAIRALGLGDLDGDGAEEAISIQLHSGRLVVYRIASEPVGDGLLDGPFERYTLRTSGTRRAGVLALGSFSDPNRLDIIVSDPDGAEVEMFAQTRRPERWRRQASFPSLRGITDLAACDTDGDGRPELLALSPEEPMLGLARFDARGRLTFPRALPLVGKPLCMAVADLLGDGKPEIIYAGSEERKRWIRILQIDAGGQFTEKLAIPLEGVKTDPDGLAVADANQDGLTDVLLFTPYQEMRIFKQTPEGGFVDASRGTDYGKGLVQGANRRTVSLGDVDGDGKDEMLLATKNFARALRLDEKDRIQVVDQFNGRSPSSLIVAAAGADLDGDSVPEIILADSATRCLTVLKRNEIGVYGIAGNLQTGPLSLERLLVTDLTADGKPELLLVGKDDFTLLRPGAPRTALRQVASYETPVKNGRLEGIAVGRLNGDDEVDLLVSEGTKHRMTLLVRQADSASLHRVLSWPVFETKTYAGRRFGPEATATSEPREFEIGDVTGDEKPDIVLLIHDRLLVYPQE